jgi:hypothetical protein
MKTLFDEHEALRDGFPGEEDDGYTEPGEDAGAGVAGSGIYTGDEDEPIEAEQDEDETESSDALTGYPPDGTADDDEANPGDDEYTDVDEDEDESLDQDDAINSDRDADEALETARDDEDDEDLNENDDFASEGADMTRRGYASKTALGGSLDDLQGAP